MLLVLFYALYSNYYIHCFLCILNLKLGADRPTLSLIELLSQHKTINSVCYDPSAMTKNLPAQVYSTRMIQRKVIFHFFPFGGNVVNNAMLY